MKTFRKNCIPILLLIATATLLAGCTAQAKKARAMRRADEYYNQGDYDKAKIEYTTALRLDPKDAEPVYKIGTMWLEEGAPLRAGQYFFRGRELAPKRADMHTKLGEVYIAVAGLAEARKEALEALQLEPNNEDALLILADAARSPEDIAQADAALKKAGGKDTVKTRLAVATLSLRKNDLPAMEKQLQHTLELDPKSSLAHLALARYRLSQNDKENAAKEFKLASDTAPARSTAHLMFAEFKAQSGQVDDAIAYLNDVVKKAPDYLPAWTLLSKITGSKNVDQALPILDNVFRRDMQNFDARMLEADYYLVKNDSRKAIDALKQLETNYPKIPIVKLELARALLQNGDGAQALTALDQTLTLAPTYVDAILLQAETNMRMGNAEKVANSMEDFLKREPTSEHGQVLLADSYRAQGRFDDADGILRKLIAAKPQESQYYLMLGALQRQQKKTADARQNLEKAFQLAQNKLASVNQLIEMDIEANDFAGALQRIAPALQQFPNEPALHLLEGKIYAYQKDWDKAEAALLKVIELNPNVQSAYDLLISVYIQAKKLPEAAQQLEASVAKNPENLGALMSLGLVYSEMKQFEKARDAYEKFLAIKSDNAVAANNLAYIYADQLNQLDKARDWAAKAHSVDPNNAAITDTFGWIVYRQGDYKQAVALLKEAADKMPDEAEVRYHYAMAAYMMGDTQAARIGFEAAALSPKDFSGKEEAKKRLDLIKEGGTASDASIDQLESLLKQQPNDPVALAKAAELYERQGAAEKAADYYEKAIKANPLPAPMIKLAQLYAGPLNKKDRALDLAKKARELAPNDARSSSIVGRLAFQSGNYVWAYSVLQDSARQLSGEPGVLKDFAWAAYANSKIPEARQTMERIAKNVPDSPEAAEAKTFLAFTAPEVANGDPSPMNSEIQQKLKEDPSYVPALMLQGRGQAGHGEKDAAIKSFTDALKKFPDFAPAQKQLAAVYLDDPNQRAKAYELASTARKALSDDVELASILGRASYFKKEYSRAAQLLQESNRKKPLDASGLFYLGMSLQETKNLPQAKETLEAAVSKGLQEPMLSEAKKVLEPPKAK